MSLQRRPRVLLVGPMPPAKGGGTTFMLNLLASYLNTEFEFAAYAISRPPKKNEFTNWGYGGILRGGIRRILQGIGLTVGRLLLFPFVVVWRRIDLIQIQAFAHHAFWEAVAYAILARLVRRPVLLRSGGSFDLFHSQSPATVQRLIACALRIPQCVIVQSGYWHDYIRRAGRSSDMIILPNWTRDPVVANTGRPATATPTFLFIAGSGAIHKGAEEVIEAARRLHLKGCAAHFHLVAVAPPLIERITAMTLSNIATMEGPVEHRRLLEIMRQTDAFLLPSHGEGFPNSLVEAMTAGMACIVTPVGAIPEIVADGGAITVPVGDVAGLVGAIERLASDTGLRHRLGEEAQAIVTARYTAAAVLPRLSDAYRRLLK